MTMGGEGPNTLTTTAQPCEVQTTTGFVCDMTDEELMAVLSQTEPDPQGSEKRFMVRLMQAAGIEHLDLDEATQKSVIMMYNLVQFLETIANQDSSKAEYCDLAIDSIQDAISMLKVQQIDTNALRDQTLGDSELSTLFITLKQFVYQDPDDENAISWETMQYDLDGFLDLIEELANS